MQRSDPLFNKIIDDIERYNGYKLDNNGILFKLIVPEKGPKFFVLCLPPHFAESILQQFHKIDRFHVFKTVMLAHYNNKFFTPGIRVLLETSIKSCFLSGAIAPNPEISIPTEDKFANPQRP